MTFNSTGFPLVIFLLSLDEGARKTPLNNPARKNQVFSISLLETSRYVHAWICHCPPVLQTAMWLAQRLADSVPTNSCTLQPSRCTHRAQLKNSSQEQWRRYDAEGQGPMLTTTALHLMKERARNSAAALWDLAFWSGITATDTARHSTTVTAAINYRARPTKELVEFKNKIPPENVFLSF